MANNKYIYSFVVQRKFKGQPWEDAKKFRKKDLADRYAKAIQSRQSRRWKSRAGQYRVITRRKPNPRYRDDASIYFYGTKKERAALERKLKRRGPYRF